MNGDSVRDSLQFRRHEPRRGPGITILCESLGNSRGSGVRAKSCDSVRDCRAFQRVSRVGARMVLPCETFENFRGSEARAKILIRHTTLEDSDNFRVSGAQPLKGPGLAIQEL